MKGDGRDGAPKGCPPAELVGSKSTIRAYDEAQRRSRTLLTASSATSGP
jgi:hypothetical protein